MRLHLLNVTMSRSHIVTTGCPLGLPLDYVKNVFSTILLAGGGK